MIVTLLKINQSNYKKKSRDQKKNTIKENEAFEGVVCGFRPKYVDIGAMTQAMTRTLAVALSRK